MREETIPLPSGRVLFLRRQRTSRRISAGSFALWEIVTFQGTPTWGEWKAFDQLRRTEAGAWRVGKNRPLIRVEGELVWSSYERRVAETP